MRNITGSVKEASTNREVDEFLIERLSVGGRHPLEQEPFRVSSGYSPRMKTGSPDELSTTEP